jgi:hypothetical protein
LGRLVLLKMKYRAFSQPNDTNSYTAGKNASLMNITVDGTTALLWDKNVQKSLSLRLYFSRLRKRHRKVFTPRNHRRTPYILINENTMLVTKSELQTSGQVRSGPAER